MILDIPELSGHNIDWIQFVEQSSDLIFTIIRRTVSNEDEAADIYVSILEALEKITVRNS